MYSVGIDVGSTYTKYCILRDQSIEKLSVEKTPVDQRRFFENRIDEIRQEYGSVEAVTCGYGRKNIDSVKNINELAALAKGFFEGLVVPRRANEPEIAAGREGDLRGDKALPAVKRDAARLQKAGGLPA